jgi:hypothetical protein
MSGLTFTTLDGDFTNGGDNDVSLDSPPPRAPLLLET